MSEYKFEALCRLVEDWARGVAAAVVVRELPVLLYEARQEPACLPRE